MAVLDLFFSFSYVINESMFYLMYGTETYYMKLNIKVEH